MNNHPGTFRFAVISDRTGGHRPGIFSRSVRMINMLQPEFVMSVGDLIEGYSEDPGQWALEWSEFESKLDALQMPFFFCVGNHDMSNLPMSENWKRKFGRSLLLLPLSGRPLRGPQFRRAAAQGTDLQVQPRAAGVAAADARAKTGRSAGRSSFFISPSGVKEWATRRARVGRPSKKRCSKETGRTRFLSATSTIMRSSSATGGTISCSPRRGAARRCAEWSMANSTKSPG